MRLLKCSSDGDITLTEQLIGYNIPTYAILSHTWGHATAEVTFKDLVNNTGRHKAGYAKIRFCADQATRDGLQYFWVDTCCIDKSDNNELSEAINSMFRWYQNAARCYVYLSNISIAGYEPDPAQPQPTWDAAFRASRWFTRGWTLQELLAPISVEFFTREGWRLGDKRSLEQQIHEITGITVSALRGTPLSRFDVDQRFKWVETRQTTRDEDWAYCLLGIFGVFMPLIYGEGRENALRRLRKEIDEALSREGLSLQSAQSSHGENVKNMASNFTAKRLDALEQKVDSVSAHSASVSDPEQRKRSIWKDGFDHGFHLDKVPLINSFIGRQEDVANIERYLLPDVKLVRRRVYVVSGIGGMGKTQLAVEFARRHQSEFSSIFFIDGSSKDALLQSFIRVFRRLAVNDINTTNPRSEKSGIEISTPEGIAEKALEWFSMEGNNRWLLIYDNVDLEPTDPGLRWSRSSLPGTVAPSSSQPAWHLFA